MPNSSAALAEQGFDSYLLDRYQACRHDTLALIAGLSEADLGRQSTFHGRSCLHHLAHISWFFETVVLGRSSGHRRGLPCRPTLAEVLDHRRVVDGDVERLLAGPGADARALARLELGIQHEQQHQENLLADLLQLFAHDPRRPVYRRSQPVAALLPRPLAAAWVAFRGGRDAIGHDADDGFAFESEQPRHDVWLRPYALAARPVSNGDWQEFMADGGYRRPALWLPEGWQRVLAQRWQAPAYWRFGCDEPLQMSLAGELLLDAQAPVCHISWFEADAFARWAGKRLPTEAEWEAAAQVQAVAGNFAGSGRLRPAPAHADIQAPLAQLYGDVWEWTASAYAPYPGFRAPAEAAGEFDGKFSSGQAVLRGGSCITPLANVRASARHFLQPGTRSHFSGLRLAEDRS